MTTTKVGNARLLKLAAFLDTLDPKKFNFSDCVSGIDNRGCGTVCCAIGWTPKVFPKLAKWTQYGVNILGYDFTKDGAGELFNMHIGEINKVFVARYRHDYNSGLPENSTPQRVANHIRKFVAKRMKKAEIK